MFYIFNIMKIMKKIFLNKIKWMIIAFLYLNIALWKKEFCKRLLDNRKKSLKDFHFFKLFSLVYLSILTLAYCNVHETLAFNNVSRHRNKLLNLFEENTYRNLKKLIKHTDILSYDNIIYWSLLIMILTNLRLSSERI